MSQHWLPITELHFKHFLIYSTLIHCQSKKIKSKRHNKALESTLKVYQKKKYFI